jgi:signal transduction histidine kinase
MTSSAPRLSLLLLLFAAACIMAGGVVLSRCEEVLRHSQDREPLRAFALALQKELLRLERLHESHLERLVGRLGVGDTLRTQRECAAIAGVVECSLLSRFPGGVEEYVRLPEVRYGDYPRPTFDSPSLERSDFRVLKRDEFARMDGPAHGWLEDREKPLMFWSQQPRSVVAFLTVETKEVAAVLNGWIVAWLGQHAEYRGLLGERALLLAPDGNTLAGSSAPAVASSEPAHWSHILATRYGNWQVVYWDKVEAHRFHHKPTLVIAAVLSACVATLGLFVYGQQRRAHRLAMQRVSFVNRVSHELRTPLTNMLLNLDIIEDSLPHEGRAASRLALVREEAGRLARLIANVLTFSRREQGSLKLRPVACCPAHVVDAVVDQFAPSFARHGITANREDTTDDTPCGLDPDALSQITANLLSNVEKYAPGAPVQISTRREGNDFVLMVRDGGPGVSAADAARVFEPFVRLDDRVAAGVTGTGLGLSIARELAQRMGGTLELGLPSEGSTVMKGACFVLRVPVVDLPKKGDSGPGSPAMIESTTSVPSPSESAPS